MCFEKLYDLLPSLSEKIKIIDGTSKKTIYIGILGNLPHSIYEKICLYEVSKICTFQREDDFSYEPYLLVEVFE